MLYCKKLDENAILPTVSHAGEDLGFDVYALEPIFLEPLQVTKIRTGISARFVDDNARYTKLGGGGGQFIEKVFGLLLRDRSSMGGRGLTVLGGVVDAGYTGEIVVMLYNTTPNLCLINSGDKIVQMIPIEVNTKMGVLEVPELPESSRKEKGFGSSGV